MAALAGKTVVITGAGGGFGQEMTRQFLRAGSHLILSDLCADGLPQTAAEVPSARGTIVGHVAADLAEPTGSDALFEGVQALAPAVDILVMNAGVAVSGRICDVPREEWERLMQVDLLAPMRLTARFLPPMIERRRGHLVYVSSVAGLIGTAGLSAYSAAKFGLRGFGEAVAGDVKRQGIDVTVLYPFFARTPILDAPHYGPGEQTPLPPGLVYEPEVVIAALLRGIRRRTLHVYPGAIPRVLDVTRRVAPQALPLVLAALWLSARRG